MGTATGDGEAFFFFSSYSLVALSYDSSFQEKKPILEDNYVLF